MSGEQFSLVWNSFPRNLSSGLYNLLTDEQLVDVTLAAEGQMLRAHKLILSVCSTYFKDLFKANSCKHPIVILKDVNYRDLSAMLHFMYQGEVNIKQEDIPSFLKVAETLRIKGLTKETDENLQDTENLGKLFDVQTNKIESMETDSQIYASEKSPTQSGNQEKKQTTSSVNPTLQDIHLKEEQELNANPDLNESYEENLLSDTEYMGENESEQHTDEQLRPQDDEPLDCTAEVSGKLKPKTEIIDETQDNLETEAFEIEKIYEKPSKENIQRHDLMPESQIRNYNKEPVNESFGLSNAIPLQDDFMYEAGAKGRRTVKGIPGSCLPLETTLRVVSELGPTLRVERGKVIRMYSCPWCLRHFTRKENLKLHVRYIHGPLESLTCKLCGNKYKNSNSLRVHSYLYHNVKREKHNKPLVSGGA